MGVKIKMNNLHFLIVFIILTAISSVASAIEPSLRLINAATSGRVEVVRDLLGQGVDVNSKNPAGRTALMGAAANGNIRTVRALLGAGADVNATDAQGGTALMAASAFGFSIIVEQLITLGADVNIKDKGGNSALSMATKGKHEEVVTLLGDAGASE